MLHVVYIYAGLGMYGKQGTLELENITLGVRKKNNEHEIVLVVDD